MKVLLILLLALPLASYSQELIENKVDEFTKHKVLRTSWEPLTRTQKLYSFIQISKVNESSYLRIKYTIPNTIFSIREGDKIMLKLANDSIVSLLYPKSQVSCKGCGVVGISMSNHDGVEVSIPLDKDVVDILIKQRISKIRVYTTKGYAEEDVKEKLSENLINELKLVQ